MINIYIANLGKYNEGILKGAWLELPATEEEIQETMVKVGVATYDEEGNFSMGKEEGIYFYEEYAIHDWECDIDGLYINQYDSIEKLNEMAEQLEELDEYEKRCLDALIECDSDIIERLLKNENVADLLENHIFLELDKEEMNENVALGYALAEMNGVIYELEKIGMEGYFDYEKYGRDAGYEGAYVASNWIAIL